MSKPTISASATGLPSRRLFLSAGSATAVFGGLHEAAASEGGDAALIALGHEFEALWAVERNLEPNGSDDELDAAIEATSAIIERIRPLNATTLEGVKIKARAISWCHESSFESFNSGDSTDLVIAEQIVRDLLAL